ncbi:Variable outer membrane protein (plasmid) [Borrelia hermsii YBT]|uniref:Variable outer membrane protein n=1 Tax=Borrelia hermsii YBT TaxID=1313295 RepID=W5T2J1_BORHE|nr:Variable outer membrane protein [Borrelia hermsii YBT]
MGDGTAGDVTNLIEGIKAIVDVVLKKGMLLLVLLPKMQLLQEL